MCNPLPPIERNHGLLNAGDLPLIQVQVFVYGIGREERTTPSGAFGEFSSRFLLAESMRTLTVVEDMSFHTGFVPDCTHISTKGTPQQGKSLRFAETASKPPYNSCEPAKILTLFLRAFAKADARSTAILVDELDAG